MKDAEWGLLTRIPLKAELYGRETYFREGLADTVELMCPEMLWPIALLLIKPDGLLTGKSPAILRFLRENGFSVVAVEQPVLTGFHWREMWRYQLNCSTTDRLLVNDLVLPGQALLLILRLERDLDVPASVWLSGLKGPSDVSAQSPQCLRRLLKQPNRILSFFHVADEPADVIRELAILLDTAGRRRVLAACMKGDLSDADREVLNRAVETAQREIRSPDSQPALARAEDALRGRDETPAARQIRVDLARMRRGECIAWAPFARAIAAAEINLDRWDLAVLGAQFVVCDEPGKVKQIKGVDPSLWSGRKPLPSSVVSLQAGLPVPDA